MNLRSAVAALLPRPRFARNVAVLAGGTVASQGVVMLSAPVLTRIYTPADLGILAVWAALLSMLGVISSLRYQLAIPLPEQDEDAAHVAVLSVLIVVGTSALTAAAVVVFGQPIATGLNAPEMASYLWLLPAGLVLVGVYQVLSVWAVRAKAFPALARTKLSQSVGMTAVQLAGYPFGPISLVLGHITGQAAGSVSLAAVASRERWKPFRAIHKSGLRDVMVRYRRFPIYSTWEGAFNTAGRQLPPVLFAALFGPVAAGLYLLAYRVLAMPMMLIGQAVAQVFFADAAVARRNGTLPELVLGVYDRLAHISLPVAVLIVAVGPQLFSWLFGEEWRVAGDFARWLSPWVFLVFVTSPLSMLFAVLERQSAGMFFQALLLTVRVLALVIGARVGGLMLAVALFAVGSAIVRVGLLAGMIKMSGNSVAALGSLGIGQGTWALMLAGPAIVVALLAPSAWIVGFTGAVILIGARYYFLLKPTWQP